MRTLLGFALLLISFPAHSAAARQKLAQNGGDSRTWPWWPVCLFVEQGAGSLKQMGENLVREAAEKCRVNILLTPYYVNQVRGSVDAVKQDAANTCELRSGFKRLGAPAASVAVVTKSQAGLVRTMCKAGADRKGCGEFSRDPGNLKDTLANIGKYGGTAKPGRAAVSIIAADAPPYELARWTLGVSMMGLPPEGNAYGMGVGTDDQYGAGGDAGSYGWNPAVCAKMRENAYTTKTPFAYAETWKISDKNDRPMSLITGKFEGPGTAARTNATGPSSAPSSPSTASDASDVREPGIWNSSAKLQNTPQPASVTAPETVPQAEIKLDASGGHKLPKPKAGNATGAAPDGMPALTNTRNLDFSKTAGGKKTPGAIGSGSGGSSGTGSLMGGPGSGVGAAGGGMNSSPSAAGGAGGSPGGVIVKGADAGNPNFEEENKFFGARPGEKEGLRRRTPSSRSKTNIYGGSSSPDLDNAD